MRRGAVPGEDGALRLRIDAQATRRRSATPNAKSTTSGETCAWAKISFSASSERGIRVLGRIVRIDPVTEASPRRAPLRSVGDSPAQRRRCECSQQRLVARERIVFLFWAHALVPLLLEPGAARHRECWVAHAQRISLRRLGEDVERALALGELAPPPLEACARPIDRGDPAGLQMGARSLGNESERLFFAPDGLRFALGLPSEGPPLAVYRSGEVRL